MRVLVTGWFSFLNGEATAGDLLAMEAVRRELAGIDHDVAWSPVLRPDGPYLEHCPPQRYTHVVFVCGPLHGEQIRALHARYARCRRIAVGVSVLDPADPAVTGFDRVLARDGCGPPVRDLAAALEPRPLTVAGVVLTTGQGEYGARRRHEAVADTITEWLRGRDCATVPLETRVDAGTSPYAFGAIAARLDVVVTTRLHGLVLALRSGVPALAIDPVDGGGKVGAQAGAWDWPALVPAEELLAGTEGLHRWWGWCISPPGRAAAADRAVSAPNPLVTALRDALPE